LFGTPQKKTLVRSASHQCVCGSSSPTLSAFVFRGSPSISFTPLVRLLLCSLLLLFLTNRALHIPLNPLKRNCLNREVVRIRRATHQGQGQISGHSHLYILYPLIKCLLVFHLGFYIVLLFEFSFQWSFGPFFTHLWWFVSCRTSEGLFVIRESVAVTYEQTWSEWLHLKLLSFCGNFGVRFGT
jgi:hypothetical protein